MPQCCFEGVEREGKFGTIRHRLHRRAYAPRDIMRCLLNMRKRGALPLKSRVVFEQD